MKPCGEDDVVDDLEYSIMHRLQGASEGDQRI